jgi:hypothetical protein
MKLGEVLSMIAEECSLQAINIPPLESSQHMPFPSKRHDFGYIFFSDGLNYIPVCYGDKFIWWWRVDPKEEKVINICQPDGLDVLIEDLKSSNVYINFNDEEWMEFNGGWNEKNFNL